jgi:hypothetical protein
LDGTTTTDSLGIVTLTMAAFKRGQITKAELQAINECADAFTDVLILANKYREVTGQSFPLDDVPPPTTLLKLVQSGDFRGALSEAAAIKVRMAPLFQAAESKLRTQGRTVAAAAGG